MAVIHSRFRDSGKATVDHSACILCGRCIEICPGKCLVMKDRLIENRVSNLGCIGCGHCMMVCPEHCISITGRDISSADLVELPAPDSVASVEALEALLQTRRSVRFFKDRPLEPFLLDRIVAMAATAPMGIPPWDVGCVIINGRERVKELAGGILKGWQGFLQTMLRPWVLKLLRPFLGSRRFDVFAHFLRPLALEYSAGVAAGEDRLFYGAPAVLLFYHSPYIESSDAMIACTYAMLAAHSMGIGTTMIGAAAPILARNRELCQRFGVPAGYIPSIALILGYPAVEFKRTVRRRFL
ncbi:nitroreductase family protein [bacterium]|nr:nitroreductase family protein [candidate division CSSED10-310 bacterium]